MSLCLNLGSPRRLLPQPLASLHSGPATATPANLAGVSGGSLARVRLLLGPCLRPTQNSP